MHDETPTSVMATLLGSALAIALLIIGANAALDALLAILH